MLNKKIFIYLFFLLMMLACKKGQNETFIYRYSMESIGNYKVEFELNQDSIFTVKQQNYFFDKYEGESRPIAKSHKMTESEYETFKELIQESQIFKMKESYGFDENAEDNTVIYLIGLSQNHKTKYVSINANSGIKFSDSFLKLIEYTNQFIDKQLH